MVPVNKLRNLGTLERCWYIVADLSTILQDMAFIKGFIFGDERCKFMTPAAVMSKLERMRELRPGGNQKSAAIACQCIAQLDRCSRHVIFDVAGDCKKLSTCFSEAAIQCCLQVMAHDLHVVLVTNMWTLRLRARACGVRVCSLVELRDSLVTSRGRPESANALDVGGRHRLGENRRDRLSYASLRYNPFACETCSLYTYPRKSHLYTPLCDTRRLYTPLPDTRRLYTPMRDTHRLTPMREPRRLYASLWDTHRCKTQRTDSHRLDKHRRDTHRRYSRRRDTHRRDTHRRDTHRREAHRHDSRRRDTPRHDTRHRDTNRHDTRHRDTKRHDTRHRDIKRHDTRHHNYHNKTN